MSKINFGVCIGAVDVPGTSDEALYRLMMEDVDAVARLGYAGIWALEHHFSSYYPTPSPLMILAHAAGRYPHLELGSMVLVAPWYQPLRLAEEIAMLSLMTRSGVHLGLGRGSAAMEYEAFGMDLDESRTRFHEAIEIVQRALAGKPFTYKGKYNQVNEPVQLRPQPRLDRITLYGAISSQPSARIMADLDLPLFCNAVRPLDMHRAVLDEWQSVVSAAGRDSTRPRLLQSHLIVADTDAEAAALARQYLPHFFQAQVEHYATDLDRYDRLKTFDMRRMQAMRERYSNPANLDDFIDLQLMGSPETVRRKLQSYVDLGFDKFVVTTNTPGIPQALRHQWLRRFANEVAPDFSSAFGKRQAA